MGVVRGVEAWGWGQLGFPVGLRQLRGLERWALSPDQTSQRPDTMDRTAGEGGREGSIPGDQVRMAHLLLDSWTRLLQPPEEMGPGRCPQADRALGQGQCQGLTSGPRSPSLNQDSSGEKQKAFPLVERLSQVMESDFSLRVASVAPGARFSWKTSTSTGAVTMQPGVVPGEPLPGAHTQKPSVE